MLRKLALVYFLIELALSCLNLFLFIDEGQDLHWRVALGYLFTTIGLTSIFSYAQAKTWLSPLAWKFILFIYIGKELFSLYPYGLYPPDINILYTIKITIHYTWLILPPILAMSYLGFHKSSPAIANKQA